MNTEKEIEKIKKCINELVYEKDKLKKAYNYYHCKRDPEQFRHLEENYGLGTPTAVSFTPLIKKHIDVLVGEYLELDQDMQVTCKDKETISNILRDKQLEIDKATKEFYQKNLENDIVNIILEGKQPVKDPFIEKKLQELKDQINRDFVSNFEIAAQNILEFIKANRDIDIKNKAQEIFTDLCIGGVCYYDTTPTAGNKGLRLRALNPLDTFVERNPNELYLNKSPRAVVRRWLTKDQILSEFGDELSEEAKTKLRGERMKEYEHTSTYRHSAAPFIIAAGQETQGILGGLEAIHMPSMESDTYNTLDDYIRVYEVQWLEIDEDGYMQRHEGVRIGEEIYITRGINEDVPRSISNPKECALSVNGIFLNDKNGQPFSMILATADLQDKYDLLIYMRDNLIASSGTVGDWLDVAHVPTILGEDLTSQIQKWIAYKKQGVALFDSSMEGTPQMNTTFAGYDDTVKGQSIQAIQLVIDSIEQQASSITGVFREKLGGIQQRDAVTNVKVGVNQSTLLTKQYFHAMDMVYKEINYDLLNLAKVVYKKNGLQGQLILGPKLNRIFTALPEHFTMTDFDIHIKDSTQTFKVKEALQQMGPDLVKNGMADVSMLIRMVMAKNTTQLSNYIDSAMEAKKAENDQIGQLMDQLKEMEQQMKASEQEIKDRDNEIKQLKQKIDAQAEEKLKLEKMRIMIERQKVENDKDTDDKLAKTKEEQLRIEWAQLSDGNPYNDKIRDV